MGDVHPLLPLPIKVANFPIATAIVPAIVSPIVAIVRFHRGVYRYNYRKAQAAKGGSVSADVIYVFACALACK